MDVKPTEAPLVAAAKAGDRAALEQLTEPYRRELHVHSYRMLGSFHDAEDAVQETFVRAWRGLDSFDGRAPIRSWLYRIATNACLNVLAARKTASRVLPHSLSPPTVEMPGREPATDIAWLEPYPDAALDGLADERPGLEARYEMREAVQLAFVAAIQLLPPRQRAVLLLHDVLGWSAAECASLLDSSAAAVNSSLQRARATLEARLPGGPKPIVAATSDEHRALIERYVRAWETTDVDGFAALLKEDAMMTMPPWSEWFRGREIITAFFARTGRPGGPAPFRLLPTAANRQPAFAFYNRQHSADWRFHSIQLLEIEGDAIQSMTSFLIPSLARVFGLPEAL